MHIKTLNKDKDADESIKVWRHIDGKCQKHQ